MSANQVPTPTAASSEGSKWQTLNLSVTWLIDLCMHLGVNKILTFFGILKVKIIVKFNFVSGAVADTGGGGVWGV